MKALILFLRALALLVVVVAPPPGPHFPTWRTENIIHDISIIIHLLYPLTWAAAPFSALEHAPKDPASLGLLHFVLAVLAAVFRSLMEVQEVSNAGTALKQSQVPVFRQACDRKVD